MKALMIAVLMTPMVMNKRVMTLNQIIKVCNSIM